MGTPKAFYRAGAQGFATLAVHAGQEPAPDNAAVCVPVYQTSTYAQISPGVHTGYEYARTGNPTRTALEENLAALEGANHGICFSSGCAAITAVLHLLKSGDHLISCDDVYGGTHRLFSKVFSGLGIETSYVDLSSPAALDSALRSNTKLLWLETPTNPMLKLCDIAELSERARAKGVLLVVDNTFASPYLQQPLSLGADIVLHSSTKYIGGHSDVIGGALLCQRADLAEQLRYLQNALGGVPAPWDCYLLLRSTKTLALRMEKHCDNAEKLAEYLAAHPKVEKVFYPGLFSSPQLALARKQMKRYGGMISCEIKGGLEESKRFLENLKIFTLGESLGGVESLIEHPAIMTHAGIPAETRASLGISDGLIRLSIGIEDVEDLLRDLEEGFAVI